jgi:hypothetical protein
VLPCPPRSPDFVPGDFISFRTQLKGSHFDDTVEIKVASKTVEHEVASKTVEHEVAKRSFQQKFVPVD